AAPADCPNRPCSCSCQTFVPPSEETLKRSHTPQFEPQFVVAIASPGPPARFSGAISPPRCTESPVELSQSVMKCGCRSRFRPTIGRQHADAALDLSCE